MPTWTGQKTKATQMQVYLDQWFTELIKRYPIYKDLELKQLKWIINNNFDPIFIQAWDVYKKLDKYFDRLRGDIDDGA